jgi:hypothetical protein
MYKLKPTGCVKRNPETKESIVAPVITITNCTTQWNQSVPGMEQETIKINIPTYKIGANLGFSFTNCVKKCLFSLMLWNDNMFVMPDQYANNTPNANRTKRDLRYIVPFPSPEFIL